MGIAWEECLRAEGREKAKFMRWDPAGSILRREESGRNCSRMGDSEVAGILLIIRTLVFLGYRIGETWSDLRVCRTPPGCCAGKSLVRQLLKWFK